MNHREFGAYESAQLEPTAWELWVDAVVKVLGHDIDGTQVVDGYSYDFAFIDYKNGVSVDAYVTKVRSVRPAAHRFSQVM